MHYARSHTTTVQVARNDISDFSVSDRDTILRLLRFSSNSKDLSSGRVLHHLVVSGLQERDATLISLFIQLYVKCGSLQDARASFLAIEERRIDSWNCLIGAYTQHGEGEEGTRLFRQLQQEAVMADNITLLAMLSVCTDRLDLISGRQLHALICWSILEDVVITTALVNMYGKVGSIDDAWHVFTGMSVRNVISWSTMIALCTKHGQCEWAFQLFQNMLEEGVLPNTFSYVSIFSACASSMFVRIGKFFHARLNSELEQHPFIGNGLTNMYGRCGLLRELKSTFDVTCKQGVNSWNILLAAHAHHGSCMDAIGIFEQMLEEKVIADKTTVVNLLSACANQMAVNEGRVIHTFITLMGFETDIAVSNSLLNMYGKCKCLDVAEKLLKDMPELDIVSWNTLISGYAHYNLGMEACIVSQQMLQEGLLPNDVTYTCILDALSSAELLVEGTRIHARVSQPNVVILTGLVNMYGKCGSLKDALKAFHDRTVQNVLLWNAVFAVCNEHEQGEEALKIFTKMHEEDLIPDNFTFSNVFCSCACEAALAKGKVIHSLAIECGFVHDLVVGTALVNMYGKCGSLADARGVFDTIQTRDVVLWTAIIQAYSQHGDGKEAVHLLNLMKQGGVRPNDITFLNVLSACSHSGLVHEGRQCFESMGQDYGITQTEDHYDCMIDLLARSGLLEEAEKLLRGMPFQASYVSWTTLLGACRNENDFERGERVGKDLIRLCPEQPSAYVVLSQVYTAAGREHDAEAVLHQMKVKGLWKLVCLI